MAEQGNVEALVEATKALALVNLAEAFHHSFVLYHNVVAVGAAIVT